MSAPNLQAVSALSLDSRARRERRRYVRHPLGTAATVRLRGPALNSSATKIVDLSEDGIGVQTVFPLQIERTLALDLEFDGEHLRLIGQVAWSEPTGRAGVRFFSLDHKALQQIQQWLFLNAVAGAAQGGRLSELLPPPRQTTTDAPAVAPHAELFLDEEIGDETQDSYADAFSPLDREINTMVSRALALTGAKGAALALFESSQLICRATCGTDTPGLGSKIATGSGLTGECIRTASVMYCRDAYSDPRVDREICGDLGIRSILALPLFAGDRVVGLLEVLSQRVGAFDPGDAKILDLLARPMIGLLFAEIPSNRSPKSFVDAHGRGDGFAGSDRQVLDVEELDRQRRLLSRDIAPPLIPLRFRAALAVAAVAVLAPAIWLAVTQGRTLLSLGKKPVVAASRPNPAAAASSPNISVSGTRLPPVAANFQASTKDSFNTLRQSARNGDVPSQFKLGAKYASGEGIPVDQSKAAFWFQRAATSGYVPAQGILGAYYWVGRGVPKNLKEAYFWSILARSGNDEISKQRVDVLAARLSQDDVQEVQKRIRDWGRQHAGNSAGTER